MLVTTPARAPEAARILASIGRGQTDSVVACPREAKGGCEVRAYTSVGDDGALVEQREPLAAGARRTVPVEVAGFVHVVSDEAY